MSSPPGHCETNDSRAPFTITLCIGFMTPPEHQRSEDGTEERAGRVCSERTEITVEPKPKCVAIISSKPKT